MLAGDERDADAAAPGAARAADAVDVALAILRRVEVDDVRDAVDVDPARCDVGRDERCDVAGLKARECLLALTLRLVAVHREGGLALAGKTLDEAIGAALGAHEDECAVALGFQLADQRADAGVAFDAYEAVLDVGHVLDRWRVLVANSVGGVSLGDAAGFAVQRCGEEERLTVARALRDDAVDRRLEAHVEHPVGLVENQQLDVVELERAAREQILKAARRCDDDVRLRGVAGLLLKADAAVDGLDLERASMRDPVRRVDDLRRQLTRRGEDQRCRATVGRLNAVDDRNHEGERLARPSRGFGEHVTPGQHVSDDEALDGERLSDASGIESAADGAGHAEVGEGLLIHDEDSCGGMGPRTIREATANPNRSMAGPKQAASRAASVPHAA